MDQTTVDVSDLDDCHVGDEAVLIGAQGRESVSAEEFAQWSGTINYEITTRLLSRIPRRYTGGQSR